MKGNINIENKIKENIDRWYDSTYEKVYQLLKDVFACKYSTEAKIQLLDKLYSTNLKNYTNAKDKKGEDYLSGYKYIAHLIDDDKNKKKL